MKGDLHPQLKKPTSQVQKKKAGMLVNTHVV